MARFNVVYRGDGSILIAQDDVRSDTVERSVGPSFGPGRFHVIVCYSGKDRGADLISKFLMDKSTIRLRRKPWPRFEIVHYAHKDIGKFFGRLVNALIPCLHGRFIVGRRHSVARVRGRLILAPGSAYLRTGIQRRILDRS